MNDSSIRDISELIDEKYVPTSIERKKAVLAYFMIGMLMSLSHTIVTRYERFHIKQAIGWWIIFLSLFVILIWFIFLPFLRLVPVFVFSGMMLIWAFFIRQARTGTYISGSKKIMWPIFMGIGQWVWDIFDLEEKDLLGEEVESDEEKQNSENKIVDEDENDNKN